MSTVIRGGSLKFVTNLATGSQPFGQKLGTSKPGFDGAWRTLLFQKGRGFVYQCPYSNILLS